MRFNSLSSHSDSLACGSVVLLASPDALLSLDLERILRALGMRLETATDGASALAAFASLEESAVVLLDIRLDWVAGGRLLAAIHDEGLRKRCAIALIADQVSDEWIQRLREGVVDDIVPRNADAAAWTKHLTNMQRGHRLLCELEELRTATLKETQHDGLTGLYNRETMLTLLFRETDRVQRLRGALCLMAFEIDDLTFWKAELGEQVGDALMVEVSARIAPLLRSYDLLGRSGALGFLLALPGCSQIGASLLAERLRMEVFGEPFRIRNAAKEVVPVHLTASFGIAASRGRSPVVVLREAEQALALAHQAGPDSTRSIGEASTAGAMLLREPGILV